VRPEVSERAFVHCRAGVATVSISNDFLRQLGWQLFFAQQLTDDELEIATPARVVAVHRSGPSVLTERGCADSPAIGAAAAGCVAVGDWVVLDRATGRVLRVLERRSVFWRLAAGNRVERQSIAANVDTLFVVTSCNHDCNPSRLERYLALAAEARVEAVVLLTKADLTPEVGRYLDAVRPVARGVETVALDATDQAAVAAALAPWLGVGRTVAFVGSSGVGKSTLINTLLAATVQATRAARADDDRGRHTTTARRMLALPGGAWLIDTPGMRELKIGASEAGVAAVFDEIEALARSCRYRDCNHTADAGCAVRTAVDEGRLAPRRFASYLKLQRESTRAAEAEWERHDRERRTGRLYKAIQRRRRDERGR
jgi:ribosome biogenesis GTPase / thiamine phosphate phosphatase